jgi:hypothetical protein
MLHGSMKLLDGKPQSAGFASASSAYGYVHGVGVNAVYCLFAD